ncbi:MAG: hypothetical protein QM530_03275 [Phycisphaerales bacterium]|nr:hypothetical protein [Phycisphaerales bacterium]
MKKFIAISFLTAYLLSTTELHQLLKLPFLVEHFVEHKEQNKRMTLWQFLSLHYAEGNAKDADYEKDMKLPFKSHDCCSSINIVAFIAQPIAAFTIQERPIYRTQKSFSTLKEVCLRASFLSNIWQPPKTC